MTQLIKFIAIHYNLFINYNVPGTGLSIFYSLINIHNNPVRGEVLLIQFIYEEVGAQKALINFSNL